jgi:hypothetical protein
LDASSDLIKNREPPHTALYGTAVANGRILLVLFFPSFFCPTCTFSAHWNFFFFFSFFFKNMPKKKGRPDAQSPRGAYEGAGVSAETKTVVTQLTVALKKRGVKKKIVLESLKETDYTLQSVRLSGWSRLWKMVRPRCRQRRKAGVQLLLRQSSGRSSKECQFFLKKSGARRRENH